jgi:hypothetical protein
LHQAKRSLAARFQLLTPDTPAPCPCSCSGPVESNTNPYCVAWLKNNSHVGHKGAQAQRTAVLQDTQQPTWNHTLPPFNIYSADTMLRLQVGAAAGRDGCTKRPPC